MGRERDYIPSNDAEFDIWYKNLCQYVTQKTTGDPPEWTHIPASEVKLLTDNYLVWRVGYVPTLKPHTPAETLAKDEARKTAEGIIRPFVGQWLMWKQVSDKEREEAGVRVKRARRPIIPPPSTVPELEPKAGVPRQIIIPYRDKGAARRGKPKDVHGIEVRWAALDKPPVNIEAELTQSSFDTKSPLILNFGEQDRGKRIYLAGRWEIEREGVKGNFGDIVSAIVP
jgi:hypothetical protein